VLTNQKSPISFRCQIIVRVLFLVSIAPSVVESAVLSLPSESSRRPSVGPSFSNAPSREPKSVPTFDCSKYRNKCRSYIIHRTIILIIMSSSSFSMVSSIVLTILLPMCLLNGSCFIPSMYDPFIGWKTLGTIGSLGADCKG